MGNHLIHADETADYPLNTSDELCERVAAIVGEACVPQLWLMFLDEEKCQLPVIVPICDVAGPPSAQLVDAVAANCEACVAQTTAATVILTLERPGRDHVTAEDRRWAGALEDAFHARGVGLAGIFLSLDSGVRPLPRS